MEAVICPIEDSFENDVNSSNNGNDVEKMLEEDKVTGLKMLTEAAVTMWDDCQGIIPFPSFEFCQQFLWELHCHTD